MNSKITISVIISAIIVIVGIFAITSQESETIKIENTLNKELQPDDEITPEIQEKLDEIEKVNSENKYLPKDREWITSGPFQIDRSEYVLGEKIFLRTAGLKFNEKGETVFLRPLNSTHYSVYFTIPFDGSDNAAYNYYLEPQLSKIKGHCTVDDFIGDWRVVFRGTDYPNLEFKITEQILPGAESSFEPVC
ncbi:hypothetical protein K0U27_01325 [archaeon]|nr:hypothetical protein [archaeon]